MEEWKDIKGYNGIYLVSNMGRVKSKSRITKCNNGKFLRPEKILRASKVRRYLNVFLYDGGKRKSVLLHRLVAMAFIPNQDGLPEIDHIDGNPENNRADNLRWVTHKQNCNNPITIAKWKGRKSARIKAVKCFSLCGDFIAEYESITIAARETNAYRENISKCCRGVYRKTNNLIFKYA